MAKETEKPKNGAAATAPAQNAPAQATEAPKGTRMRFNKEKKLAYLMAGLVAILESKAVVVTLTDEQKAKVAKAKTQANEIGGGDPFKDIDDRIKAIQVELQNANKLMATDLTKAVEQVKELSSELDRQIKRKKQIEEMIGG